MQGNSRWRSFGARYVLVIISLVPSWGLVVDERDKCSSCGKRLFMVAINFSRVGGETLRTIRRMRVRFWIARSTPAPVSTVFLLLKSMSIGKGGKWDSISSEGVPFVKGICISK